MSEAQNPSSFLPLRHVEFEILLVLSGGESHGYAIIKESETRWEGATRIGTGTLYRALRRLMSAGLVQSSDSRPAPEVDDERRRYYAITQLGRGVAAAEANRLAVQVETARTRALLSGAGSVGGES